LEVFANSSLIALIAALLPLLSFIWIICLSNKGQGSRIAVFNILISFLLSIVLFIRIWNKEPVYDQLHWFTIGQWELNAGILLNNLSVLMLLLVSGISLVVHVYSIEYMRDDPFLHRYWAYLGLFCFSMMSLVIAGNLLLVYIFWELVGFSSYLLIGFWFTRDASAQAAKKAFIMNRIGDLGFLAGIMIIFTQFHTLDMDQLFGQNGLVSQSVVRNGLWINGTYHLPAIWLSLAGGAFFFGAIAKSAQFPLHTWLPDAMEGPTSISSLIHAATMVAAGVFLIVRVYPIFNPDILTIITVTGIFTAFMAATICLVQNDIKKILAFSTISQLGFMMLALGIGAPNAGIFHLATHAFFKCLLFLAAGAVINELKYLKEKEQLEYDYQDIRNMGGMRRLMPVTFVTMLIASLALAGIPFTSGYLSKDIILIRSFEWSASRQRMADIVPYLAVLTSWISTFYIARLMFKVFFGEFRFGKKGKRNFSVDEAPGLMKWPLMVLALCCFFPIFSYNPLLAENAWILKGFPVRAVSGRINSLYTIIPGLVSFFSLALVYLAFIVYVKRDKSRAHATGHNPLYKFIYHQWYFDKIYGAVFVKPIVYFSELSYGFDRIVVDGIVNIIGRIGLALAAVAAFFDRYVVDAAANMLGSISKSIGNFTRHFQTGRLQHYMVTMLIAVLAFFILKYFSQVI